MKQPGWWHWPVMIAVAGAVITTIFLWPGWQAQASVLAAYAARTTCACRYVEGRIADSCARSHGPVTGLWLVRISEEPAARTVSATVPLLATQTARKIAGFGCLIQSGPESPR